MNKKNAEKLWDDLRDTFQNAEKIILKIIEEKAWEPLGYATFAEAWADRMAGVRLATDVVKANALYACFDEGMGDDEARRLLDGVGPEAVRLARVYHEKGVKREDLGGVSLKLNPKPAKSVVRQHERSLPSEPNTVHVKFSEAEYRLLKATATFYGKKPEDYAKEVLSSSLLALPKGA